MESSVRLHVNLGVTVYVELFPLHRFGSRTNEFAIVLFLAGTLRRHKCCRSSATILVYPFGPMPRPRYRRDHAGLRQENWCRCVRAYKRHKQGAIIYFPTHLHRNWTGSPYGNSTKYFHKDSRANGVCKHRPDGFCQIASRIPFRRLLASSSHPSY